MLASLPAMNDTATNPSPTTAPTYNGMAITAFVATIAGLVIPFAWPIAGIAGRAAMNERDVMGEAAGGGMWMAKVGRIVGWIWAALLLVVIIAIYSRLS